jgi:probable HAF family extracellular repeat protein
MNMKFEKRVAAQLAILAFALSIFGCGGGVRPTATLSATPSSVSQGASSTLTWHTTHATDVSINGLGTVQPNGSQSVTPAASITYTLTAQGPGGTQTATATVTVTALPPPPPSGTFTITILPPLPGAAEASAQAINDAGIVVGYSVIETGGQQSFEATMWQNGVPSDLGSGMATAIDSNNQVVGSAVDTSVSATEAWFWSAQTGRVVIDVLPGFGPDSVALGIDDDGTVVGQGFTNGTPSKEGFTWRMDTGIQGVPGTNVIYAVNSGIMAAQSNSARAATVAIVNGQPVITDLGAPADVQSSAFAINKVGHACGEVNTLDGSTHAFFWNQSLADLGTGGTRYSSALAINDSDQIVGLIGDSPGMLRSRARLLDPRSMLPRTLDNFDRAMIWTQAMGVVDLNTLVTSPVWTMSLANGINNKGEIVGTAFDQNQVNQAFILEPN